MAKAPKCRFCKKDHYGNCGVSDTRGLTTAPANEAEATRDIIRRGKRTFVEVGEALMKMRDKKLYKKLGHANFQEFCDAEGLSHSYAYRVMDSAKVAANVPIGDIPYTESQARALAPVVESEGPAAAAEVMEAVGPKPTAGKIRKAVQQRLGSGEVEQPCPHPRLKCMDCREVIEKGKLA